MDNFWQGFDKEAGVGRWWHSFKEVPIKAKGLPKIPDSMKVNLELGENAASLANKITHPANIFLGALLASAGVGLGSAGAKAGLSKLEEGS